MMKRNNSTTNEFDLEWPGLWIMGEDRDWAGETQEILYLVEQEFIIAVTSYIKYKPITRKSIQRLHSLPKYKECLNTIYARSYLLSLDLISKLLKTLERPPESAYSAIQRYIYFFGFLKHLRDSIAHLEDRGRA